MNSNREAADCEKEERPLPYDPHLHVRMAKKLRSRGLTEKDLAEVFDVSLETLNSWRSKHRDFSAACNEPPSKLAEIEEAMYRLATGYSYVCEKPVNCGGTVVNVKHSRYVPADFAVGQFLLMNLAPDKWKHHSKIVPETSSYNPLEEFMRELAGTSIRPKLPTKSSTSAPEGREESDCPPQEDEPS